MKLLFLLTGTAIVTYWFYLKLLNPFIDSVIAIMMCAVYVPLLSFFRFMEKIHNAVKKKVAILFPLPVKVLLYFMVGVGIFVLDHFYGTKLYEADETTFYHVLFQGKTYWITEAGLVIGGFFIGLATLIVIIELWKAIDNLLSRPIRISVVIQK